MTRDRLKSGPYQNTDRELWRERPGDYYADSIHVTQSGAIGINVGGSVIVAPVRTWHAALDKRQPEQVAEGGADAAVPCFKCGAVIADRADVRCVGCQDESYALGVQEGQKEAAVPSPSLNVEELRADCHGTYNGGWHHSEDGMKAFHHGMDTVCNVLADMLSKAAVPRIAPSASEPSLLRADVQKVIDRIRTWEGNEEGLDNETVIEWREQLEACLTVPENSAEALQSKETGSCANDLGSGPPLNQLPSQGSPEIPNTGGPYASVSDGVPVTDPSPAAPLDRVAALEAAIRSHRDARGDDRCWIDDEELYKVLPEGYTPPARDTSVELSLCRKFIQNRRDPATVYVSPEREIERLQAEVTRLRTRPDLQQLIEQWKVMAQQARAIEDFGDIWLSRAISYEACADQLAALIASPRTAENSRGGAAGDPAPEQK